jgi:membrane-bound lytic murein transglycosylase B
LPDFGVKPAVSLPAETPCALIELETPGQASDFRLGLRNFQVLTRYNRSNLYAAAVFDLATEIARSEAASRASALPQIPADKKP